MKIVGYKKINKLMGKKSEQRESIAALHLEVYKTNVTVHKCTIKR